MEMCLKSIENYLLSMEENRKIYKKNWRSRERG